MQKPASETTTAGARGSTGVLASIAVLAAVGGMAVWLGKPPALAIPDAPLARAPASATAVMWVDVDAVLASRVWARLVSARGLDRPIRELASVCDASPLERIDEVVAFATSGSRGRLERTGFVARGDLGGTELDACIEAIVRAEGGALRRTEVDGEPAIASRGMSRAVIVGDRGIVIGDERTVKSVLASLRGDARRASDDPVLSALWSDAGAGGADALAVAHVPEGWRSAIDDALRDLGGEPGAIGRVRALGATARMRDGLAIDVALAMRDEADAEEASAGLGEALDAAVARAAERYGDLPSLLGSIDVAPRESHVVVALRFSAAELERVIDIAELVLDGDEPDAVAPTSPPAPDAIVQPGG